ncbi:peptidoglycan-binding protein [Microbacterium sp. BG28]|uniref:peptidoglycan-binding protein n=1 Tax=Microbacterium sp. BG28 TaxID=3097356 RepID=UPI002A59FB99|nr:peptidoglycan-binding protein [Microbacterium sp. BG28]MDY0828595.1 peptidoglycan-binding protein [Microbacterium sp. BG28]
MATLKNHPGFWLRDDAARAFDALEDKHGVFTVNSAGRTVAEQQDAINRWDRGGAANRPPYLYQPARPATASNHVKNGGVAVDVREYDRFRRVAGEFGFRWFGSSDPVHFDFMGWGGGSAAAPDQVTRDRQSWLNHARGENLAVDGIEGPATRAAYQRYQAFLGVAQDGVWGAVTQAAHQRFYDSVNRPQIAVDGAWGPATTRALQAALGVAQDGVLGPDTYRAIQARTGSTADGFWGSNSKRALQRHLGVPDDGEIGPQTVTALQQRLNAGNF